MSLIETARGAEVFNFPRVYYVQNCYGLAWLVKVNLELVLEMLGCKLVVWQLFHERLSSACGSADAFESRAGARCSRQELLQQFPAGQDLLVV